MSKEKKKRWSRPLNTKPVTVALTPQLIATLNDMVNKGVRASKSWIMRECLYKSLPAIIRDAKKMKKALETNQLINFKKMLEARGFRLTKVTGPPAKGKINGNPFYDDLFDKDCNPVRIKKVLAE